MQMTNNETVNKLNELLTEEMSVFETYNQALERFENASIKCPLQQAKISHSHRVDILKNKIRQLDAEPTKSFNLRGAFIKLIELGSQAFGEKAVVTILEELENSYLAEYQELTHSPDSELQEIAQGFLPSQEKTYNLLNVLKTQLP